MQRGNVRPYRPVGSVSTRPVPPSRPAYSDEKKAPRGARMDERGRIVDAEGKVIDMVPRGNIATAKVSSRLVILSGFLLCYRLTNEVS